MLHFWSLPQDLSLCFPLLFYYLQGSSGMLFSCSQISAFDHEPTDLHSQHWKELSRVDELIMIIPVVLNLKGNLEMNLSARLSTAANIGELDKPETRRQIILGNLTLLQVQASVVSFVAACVAFILGRIMAHPHPPAAPAASANATLVNATVSVLHDAALAALSGTLESRKPRPPLPQTGKKISGPQE